MRSYKKCYRSDDFKTIFDDPPAGLTVANPGQNAAPGQVAEMAIMISSLFRGEPFFAIQIYNRIAAATQWIGLNDDPTSWTAYDAAMDPLFNGVGIPIDGDSGLTLANEIFDLQFYADHPLN